MSLKSGLVRSIVLIVRTAEIMAALTLIIGVTLNFVNVIGRYVFSAPIPWAEEVMVFLMITGVFLGASAVTLRGSHIRMDLAVHALPRPLQRVLDVLTHLAFIATAAALIWFAYPVIAQLADFDQRSEVLRIPIYLPHSVIPIGFGLMILAAFARMIDSRIGGDPHAHADVQPDQQQRH